MSTPKPARTSSLSQDRRANVRNKIRWGGLMLMAWSQLFLIIRHVLLKQEFNSAKLSLMNEKILLENRIRNINATAGSKGDANSGANSGGNTIYMVAVADKMFQQRYAVIFDSMSKYAHRHGYQWRVIGDTGTEPYCEQKYTDFFFRKHCIVAKWMEKVTNRGDRIFVSDSDVVPYRTDVPLLHWSDLDEDLIFYDRTWNTEVMAGNYAVRNTLDTQNFLLGWADYEKERPPGFSSADNGAIHLHLIRTLGMESSKNGRCAQKYYNLTALVTNLNPYYSFVDCTRNLAKAGTYKNTDSSLSVRIMKKDTAWVMDGVYDGYGKDGHGPEGIGPVFHHGIKLHGNDEDMLAFDKYGLNSSHTLESIELKDACNPIKRASRCTSEANELGAFLTPGECAKATSIFRSCGDTFMFSTSYPSWGCRSANDMPKLDDELWAVYSSSGCIVKK